MDGQRITAHALENAESDELGQKMRAAVTGKRQSQSGYRQEADVHPDIDDEMAHKEKRQPQAVERFEICRAAARRLHDPPNH